MGVETTMNYTIISGYIAGAIVGALIGTAIVFWVERSQSTEADQNQIKAPPVCTQLAPS